MNTPLAEPEPVRLENSIYVKFGTIAAVNAIVTDAKWAALSVDAVTHFEHYAKIDLSRTVVTMDLKCAQRMFDEALQTLWRLHSLITIGAPPAMP